MIKIKRPRQGNGGFKGDKTRPRLLSTTNYTTPPPALQPPLFACLPWGVTPPPGPPITERQRQTIIKLANQLSRDSYRHHRERLSIPEFFSLERLSRKQARLLIDQISNDLQMNNPHRGGRILP